MTTHDPLERLGRALRDDLRAAAGPPPVIAPQSRARTMNVAVIATTAVAILAVVLVGVPRLLPGTEVTIEPIAPTGTDDGPNEGRDADGGQDPPRDGTEVEVVSFDMPEPVPAQLLSVRFNQPSIAVIDLERGEATTYPPGTHGLTGDAIGGGAITQDGTIIVWQDDTVNVFVDGLDAPPLAHTPEEMINPPDAAPSLRVVPTSDGEAMWVVQIGACCPEPIDSSVELVDLATGQVELTAELPAGSFPIAAAGDRLVLNTSRYTIASGSGDGGADDHRVLVLDEDGTSVELAAGEALAANDEVVAVLVCDDHERRVGCHLDLVDLSTGDRREVTPPTEGSWSPVTEAVVPGDLAPWSAAAPDGRLLVGLSSRRVAEQKPFESHLVVLDPDAEPDGEVATVLMSYDGPLPIAAWDRRGRQIVMHDGTHGRRETTVHDIGGSTLTHIGDLLSDDHHVIAIS